MAGLNLGGMDIARPINRIRAGACALLVNVRAYLKGTAILRNLLSSPIITPNSGQSVQNVARLNDSTPAGPVGGFTLITNSGGNLYNESNEIASGLSGNPISLIPFRPNASVRPWMYTGDSSQAVTIIGPPTFATNGMLKISSTAVTYKAGIKEPQVVPLIGINTTSVTEWISLPATSPPWTNINGANAAQNYGGTDTQPPFPAIISTPVAGSTVTLTVTGTATVNGAPHAPGDAGPSGAGFPGAFIVTPVIVLFAFTDANGNIIAQSTAVGAPPVLGNVGAGATLTVPSGAAQLQIGIDSHGGTFAANSGSYLIQAVVSTNAITAHTAISGLVTAYVWGDSPHSGPVAAYIWKNPNDSGTGTARTIDTASTSANSNSLIFDSSPEDGTVPVEWSILDFTGAQTGTIDLFNPALETQGYQDFNAVIVGQIFFPAGGVYNIKFVNKDQVMFGMGGGITSPNQPAFGTFGQSITVAQGLPLLYVSAVNGAGGAVTSSFTITVPGTGIYSFEIDWDYWEHTGRSLIVTIGATAGGAVATIPPLPQGVRNDVSYAYKYRNSATGAVSNPSPMSIPELVPVLANTVMSAFSNDPQVDKVDYYRQDSALANYTYVGTGPNDGLGGTINGVVYNTAIVDTLSDLAAASNPIMDVDDFEPVPSIDTPKAGVVTITAGVITWKSGDQFNTRWLAGTVILIGSPTQNAYTLVTRPTSATTMVIPDVPDTIGDAAGDGVPYNIAEPILANQPLPYLFGPTDNINFAFGVGDPLRPGTLYWSKGNNLDSWPDTNQQDVTDPNEALVNGAMASGLGVLFSIKRAWLILPNFFNAQATATGTSGSTWSLQNTAINRGLFIPRCLCVEGGGRVFFRVDDGIHVSMRGASSQSITDEELYPLFEHEGSTPTSVVRNGVTIVPPNDTLPQSQKFQIVNGYFYYDYIGIDAAPHTLVFDLAQNGWVWDTTTPATTCHATNEGQSVQGVLAGCTDGSIRQMLSTGATETATATLVSPAIGGQGWCYLGPEMTIEYSAVAGTATVQPIAADVANGSYYSGPALLLPATGGVITKYKINPSANKFKLMQFQFQWTDPAFQLYLEGFVVNMASWGADLKPVMPFANDGGRGGQIA